MLFFYQHTRTPIRGFRAEVHIEASLEVAACAAGRDHGEFLRGMGFWPASWDHCRRVLSLVLALFDGVQFFGEAQESLLEIFFAFLIK